MHSRMPEILQADIDEAVNLIVRSKEQFRNEYYEFELKKPSKIDECFNIIKSMGIGKNIKYDFLKER